MNINLQQGDCLELLKTLEDNSIDLIFTDPPYALGSEVVILPNGKPEYKKAVDFMSKWEQPNGVFWEEWFAEAKRVLKHGGHCLMFGMDRQLWFNCYYANLSGFTQKQSLYWYFISNFPKASDLSKNIDKKINADYDYIVKLIEDSGKSNTEIADYCNVSSTLVSFWRSKKRSIQRKEWLELANLLNIDTFNLFIESEREIIGAQKGIKSWNIPVEKNVTIATPPLAKKYEGIKYSVAPLKQTNETIMVFQKPYKTGSCLHDVLTMENGDNSITCGGVDIEGNRVPAKQGEYDIRHYTKEDCFQNIKPKESKFQVKEQPNGRFPAQTYIDSGASAVIDLQSGFLHPAENVNPSVAGGFGKGGATYGGSNNLKQDAHRLKIDNGGGASRILHKCDYELEDYDLYYYCPKVSKSERNEGLEGFELKQYSNDGRHTEVENPFQRNKSIAANNHPTLKPKALLSKILKLFKTPNDQIILDPFMGSGSMGISAIETGFDYIGYELDPEYFKIAEARIENAQSKLENQLFYSC